MTKKKESKKAKQKKGTGLKWIPIDDLSLIPRYLVEQIEPMDFDVNQFYKFGHFFITNGLSVFGVFADSQNIVKGYMWCAFNPLTNRICVMALSIDKEYQGMGIVGEAANIVKKIKQQCGAEKIEFQTIFPEKFEKAGAVKSEKVIMELE